MSNLHVALAGFLCVTCTSVLPAQPANSTAKAAIAQVVPPSLSDFVGTYDYQDGTIELIAADQLIAVLNGNKYKLRHKAADIFVNGAGADVIFRRGADGRVVSLQDETGKYARLSDLVLAQSEALLRPRPLDGPAGSPAVYRYEPPPQLSDGIRVGRAGRPGISPKIAEQLVNGVISGKYADVHSLLIYHKGSLVLEEYFYGFDRNRPHEMRSLTKSVISLLAGVAVDRGLLPTTQPVLHRLGYSSFGNPDPRKAKVTLTHLLSNQSGFACNEHDSSSPGHEMKLFDTADWVKSFVDLPMIANPGTTGSYCSGNFHTAGRIVEHATAKPLPEFADQALFQPLGIRKADWKWNFTLDRSQRNAFGYVHLRPRDMLKLGILIQDRGKWRGQQVISRAWMEAAVSRQSRIDDSDYGLGIWHRFYGIPTPVGQRTVDTILLTGNGGQKIQLVPSLDLIVVSTGNAFFVNSPINEMLSRVLMPALLKSEKN